MSFQLSLSTESVSAAYPEEPTYVTPTAPLGDVIQLFAAQQTGSVLVCEDGADGTNLLGIFTERDALRCMAAVSDGSRPKLMSQPVSTVMSTELTTLSSDTSVSEAIQRMSQGGFRHLPVVDETGTPTGMENVYGIVHYLVDHFPQTVYNLPPNPQSIPSEREGA